MPTWLADYDYHLPESSIAQTPLPERDASRMLLLERFTGGYQDRRFSEFPDLLRGNELIVVNNARVIPARLFGHRAGNRAGPRPGKGARHNFLSSRIEVLLTKRVEPDVWEALVRPGRKIRAGERIHFDGGLAADVVSRGDFGLRLLRFSGPRDSLAIIEQIGHVPLPPYIRRSDEPVDRERYQTVFAKRPGAVATPTAGLHFNPEILRRITARGVEICEINLEVGLGTFQPIHAEDVETHTIHAETYEIPKQTADSVLVARSAGRPILAIGTTVVRALEDAARKAAALNMAPGSISPGRAEADIFIRPGHRFVVVDQLLTNFHLPRSTLLLLVAAFGGKDHVLLAYRHAVDTGYRFYSYGDCMLMR